MKKGKAPDNLMAQIVAGRTFDEQVEDIRKYGNHGVGSVLRDRALLGAGIPKPKASAENAIVFGCYLPFIMPQLLREYMEILDRLGLEYTYLEKEFCCGLPMIETPSETGNGKAMAVGEEFMRMNRDLALQKGATTISYCCVWCAHLAKKFFPNDTAVRHLYYPDLMLENLENSNLKIAPTVLGYYEGCHRRNRTYAPGIDLDWEKYRGLLTRIEGLEIVDLPQHLCCSDNSERIVQSAEKSGVDTILCSCVSCYRRVGIVAQGRVKMKQLSEIILQALAG